MVCEERRGDWEVCCFMLAHVTISKFENSYCSVGTSAMLN